MSNFSSVSCKENSGSMYIYMNNFIMDFVQVFAAILTLYIHEFSKKEIFRN